MPPITVRKNEVIESIIKVQVAWMEEFAAQFPKFAGNARSIRTKEDTPDNTSYETYLCGELGTYSDATLGLYGGFIISIAKKRQNLARMCMTNSARLYGYKNLGTLEESL